MLEAEVRLMNRAIKELGLWVIGSQGQQILNPAFAARRAALEAIRKLDLTAPAQDPAELDAFLRASA